MILYNYWIKFANKQNDKVVRIAHERGSWRRTPEEAERALQEDLARLKGTNMVVYPIASGIEAKDFGDRIEIAGIVGDNDDPYNSDILIGDTSLNDALREKFYGLDVKITIEFK